MGLKTEKFLFKKMDEYARDSGYSSWDALEKYLSEKNFNTEYVIAEIKGALFNILYEIINQPQQGEKEGV